VRIPRLPSGSAGPRRHDATGLTLAVLFALVVVYASLYPFGPWTWPAGQPLARLLAPPWPHWHTGFDDWSNFVGYMPLGALVYVGLVGRVRHDVVAGAVACASASALSWAMEFLQHFLPGRVPSLMDWTLNSLGAGAGVTLAVAVQAAGAGLRWHAARERWFSAGSGRTLALLMIWPLGFLFPTTLPFGQGLPWERLQDLAFDTLSDHPLAPWFEWIWADMGDDPARMSTASQGLVVALGLAAPCLVAYTVVRPGWRRAVVVAGATLAGFGANTLSAALNFGPSHALGWVTAPVPVGLAAGAALALACWRAGPRAAAALGLVALSLEIALVAQAPTDPYYAESLQAWEQGRFIRFHGLAQWVGWLWPFAAATALFWRIVRERAAGEAVA
jgi:VanZ family protein